MAAHFINSDVTAVGNTMPQVHAGLNYFQTTYKLQETATASMSIAMCALPGGARIVDATLGIDNNAFDTTGGGNVAVITTTGGNSNGAIIQSASGSLEISTYNPVYAQIGYRHTSSSIVQIALTNFVDTGTATTIFSLAITYDCQKEGDG